MRTFTFGFDHKHPITGESLARHYIQVPGEDDLSRRFMHAVFGRDWAMQYKDPSNLKYLERMTELKWTTELLGLITGDDRDLFESVTGDRLEVHFGLEPGPANAEKVKRDLLVDEYFDTMKDLPPVETHTGTPVVEYAMRMVGGGVQTFPDSDEVEEVYPLGKRLFHHMQYGGKVYRRRYLLIEDWSEVDESDPVVADAVKEYREHEVDLTPKDIKLP